MILVYEYIANHTLEDHLHRLLRDERLTILIGVARALCHLQYFIRGGSFNHREFKSSNILLDDNFVAKVSLDDLHSHVSTADIGTFGYVDPSV